MWWKPSGGELQPWTQNCGVRRLPLDFRDQYFGCEIELTGINRATAAQVTAIPSVEVHGNKLCGCLTVELKEPLLDDEQTVLCNYISGQYSDGWGEGFEQRDIRVDDGTLAVHFWQEDGFKMTPSFEKNPKPEKNSLRPKMQLIGQDGNIFAIMGRASRLLKNAGQSDKAKEMCDRVTASQSYSEALNIVSEYVETELSPTPAPKRDRGDAR